MNSDFNNLVTLENLFSAWCGFRNGKRNKVDVMQFERNLEDNIFQLYEELSTKTYKHQGYSSFHICDPKFRVINKAAVRDRVVHHLIYNFLEPLFQPAFIHQSYSCQKGKGVHVAVRELGSALRKASKNYTAPVWSLKLDIKKFFDSIDHEVLFALLKRRVKDPDILWLLAEIIGSFSLPSSLPLLTKERLGEVAVPDTNVTATLAHGCVEDGNLPRPAKADPSLVRRGGERRRGVPIGNLTSQIFANVYLSELDYFAKFHLRERYYFRYADDFIFLYPDKARLERVQSAAEQFVRERLRMTVHPNKIIYRKLSQGVDFVGYVLLPHYRVLRTKTKHRMFKKVRRKVREYNQEFCDAFSLQQTTQAYLGVLKHCSGYTLEQYLCNEVWYEQESLTLARRDSSAAASE